MEIRVDGNRSTNESWLEAHRIPAQSLPVLSEEEQIVAHKLAIPAEEYSRSKYAAELTRRELEVRACRVGQLVEGWLREHGIPGEVKSVWLKTFEGKFRVDVQARATLQSVFVKEELIDDVLDSGSKEAHRSLLRLLSSNFLVQETARAS